MNFLFYSRFVYLDRGNFGRIQDVKSADADVSWASFGTEDEGVVAKWECQEAADARRYTRQATSAPQRLAVSDPVQLRGTTRLQRENPRLFAEANEVLNRAENGKGDEYFEALSWVLSRQQELGFDYDDFVRRAQHLFDQKEGLRDIDRSAFGREVEYPMAAQRKMLMVARQIQRELETVQRDFDNPNGKLQTWSPYVREQYVPRGNGILSHRAVLDPKLVAERFRQVDLHDGVLAQQFANRVQYFGAAQGNLLENVRGFIRQNEVQSKEAPGSLYSPNALGAGTVHTIANMREQAAHDIRSQVSAFGGRENVMGQYASQTAQRAEASVRGVRADLDNAYSSRGDSRPVASPVNAQTPQVKSEEAARPGFWSRMANGAKDMAKSAATAVTNTAKNVGAAVSNVAKNAVSSATNTVSSLGTKAKSKVGSWLSRAKSYFRGPEKSAT